MFGLMTPLQIQNILCVMSGFQIREASLSTAEMSALYRRNHICEGVVCPTNMVIDSSFAATPKVKNLHRYVLPVQLNKLKTVWAFRPIKSRFR